MIETLIKAGADPNATGPGGATPLMKAATSGSVEAVNALIAHGADVNAKESAHGQTALMFAAAAGRGEVIKTLAAHGADMKVTTNVVKLEAAKFDDNGNPIPARGEPAGGGTVTGGNTVMGGMTALLFAAREGKLEAVKALVEAGADVNQISAGEHSTPLIIASENSHYEVAKYLVDHGADPNLANVDGLAALYAVIDNQYAPLSWVPVPLATQEKVSHIELMADMLEHGANPNVQIKRKLWFRPSSHDQQWVNPTGATPFWRAAQADDVDAMKLLIAHGADPKITSTGGDNALMVAAGLGWSGNFSQNDPSPTAWMDSVKYLIEDLHCDVNAADKQGFTPIMGASWRGNNEVIKYLVDKGAKLDVRNNRGWSVTDMANAPALRSSVPVTHPETIAYLIKLGAPELTPIVGEAQLGSNRGRGRGGRGAQQPPADKQAPAPSQPPR
jgi:ankyrin repeat protein